MCNKNSEKFDKWIPRKIREISYHIICVKYHEVEKVS